MTYPSPPYHSRLFRDIFIVIQTGQVAGEGTTRGLLILWNGLDQPSALNGLRGQRYIRRPPIAQLPSIANTHPNLTNLCSPPARETYNGCEHHLCLRPHGVEFRQLGVHDRFVNVEHQGPLPAQPPSEVARTWAPFHYDPTQGARPGGNVHSSRGPQFLCYHHPFLLW